MKKIIIMVAVLAAITSCTVLFINKSPNTNIDKDNGLFDVHSTVGEYKDTIK